MDWGKTAANLDYSIALPILGRLPVSLAYRLSDIRAAIRNRIRKVSRERAIQNLALAFPDLEPCQHWEMAIDSLRVIARDELETYWYDCPLSFLESRIEESSFSIMREAAQRGRGVLLCTGHMGNPGIFLAMAGRSGYPINLVFRPIDDFPLNPSGWLRFGRNRVEKLQQLAERPVLYAGKVSYFHLRRLLRSNESVMMAIDVVPSLIGRSVRTSFLGKTCSFPEGIPRLCLDTRPSVLFWSVQRIPGNKYSFVFEDLTAALDSLQSVEEIAQRLVSCLERRIRLDPAAWMQWDAFDQFFAPDCPQQ
jgi:KDO2-lipid IV(A) lauroyltransferase